MRSKMLFLLIFVALAPYKQNHHTISPVSAQIVFLSPGETLNYTLLAGETQQFGVPMIQGLSNYSILALYPVTVYLEEYVNGWDNVSQQFGVEINIVGYFNYSGRISVISEFNTQFNITLQIYDANPANLALNSPSIVQFGAEEVYLNFTLSEKKVIRMLQWGFRLNRGVGTLMNGSGEIGAFEIVDYLGGTAHTQISELDSGNYSVKFATSFGRYIAIGILITDVLDLNEAHSPTIMYDGLIYSGIVNGNDADIFEIYPPDPAAILIYPRSAASDLNIRVLLNNKLQYEIPVNQESYVEYTNGMQFLVTGNTGIREYFISVEIIQPDRFEPNDSEVNAGQLSPGLTTDLTLHNNRDWDWFLLHLDSYSVVEMELSWEDQGVQVGIFTNAISIEENWYYSSIIYFVEHDEGDMTFRVNGLQSFSPSYSINIIVRPTSPSGSTGLEPLISVTSREFKIDAPFSPQILIIVIFNPIYIKRHGRKLKY